MRLDSDKVDFGAKTDYVMERAVENKSDETGKAENWKAIEKERKRESSRMTDRQFKAFMANCSR